MEKRRHKLSKTFTRYFDKPPSVWARAPGRVDLMGSHTDYNMGYVMTMSIDRDTWIAARPREDNKVTIRSLNVPGSSTFALNDINRDEKVTWSNYIRGVALALQTAGHRLRGFDGLVHSTVPFGSGLSSSAALEMAAVVLFENMSDISIEPVDKALIGQKAENEFVGVNTGILDQYSSVMGRQGSTILLDCRSLTHEVVPLSSKLHVVICNTMAERNLTGTEYDERRAQCEEGVRLLQQFYPEISSLRDVTLAMFATREVALPEVVAKRCRFVIEENQRVLDLAPYLPGGRPETLRPLFDASYVGARDLYEIGAPAMAQMMSAMLSAPGVVAARQAGAGFGGSMVALIQDGFAEPFSDFVTETYAQKTGIEPEVYAVEPAPGAMVIDYEGDD
jgi:galactokinase